MTKIQGFSQTLLSYTMPNNHLGTITALFLENNYLNSVSTLNYTTQCPKAVNSLTFGEADVEIVLNACFEDPST